MFLQQKYNLAAHQVRAVEEMHKRNVALWYDPGTGKTACTLAYIADRINAGDCDNALVVCPAGVVPSWIGNIKKMNLFAGYDEFDVQALKDVVKITSYGKVKSNGHLNRELEKSWDVIVADESHALGDRQSQQTKAMLKLSQYADRRIILTGTPDGRRYEKLYGQIKFLDPGMWTHVKDFDTQMITERDFFKKPLAYNEQYAMRLKDAYGLYAKLDECYDMPGILDNDIRELPLFEKTVYKDIRNLNVAKYGINPQNGGSGIKLLQVVSGHLKTDESILKLKTSKTQALTDIIVNTDEPLVIFCHFTQSVKDCAAIAQNCGRDPIIYDGSAPVDAWQEFQNGSRDVIVCQYQRGGVGIDLFKAHTSIFFEPTGSSINHIQARARTYRKGQTTKTRYIYLVTDDIVEKRLNDRMLSGLDTPENVINSWIQTK